jgi:preprotein translocase subunit YajC
MMKRAIFALAIMLVVFVAVFAVLALRPLPKVKAHYGCSNATLRGNYGLTASGFFGSASPFSPSTVVGLVTFDGHGNLSGDVNLDGGGHLYGATNFSGVTYTVSPTCTITTSTIDLYGTNVTLNGTVVDAIGGSEVITDMEAPTTQDTTLTVDMKKVQGWD